MKKKKDDSAYETITIDSYGFDGEGLAFNTTLDQLLEGVQVIDYSWRYVYVNNAALVYEGTTREKLLGFSMIERFPGLEQTEIFSALSDCMTRRKPREIETQFIFPDKRKKWFQVSVVPVKEGILLLSLDVTDRKDSEEKILKSNHLYSFISQINQNIVRVKDEGALFHNACRMALEFGKFKMAWIGKFDEDHKTISLVDQCGISVEDVQAFFDKPLPVEGIQKDVLHSGAYFVCNDVERESATESLKPFARVHGIHSFFVLPIRKSGKIFGTLNLYAAELNFSGQDEINLLVEVATDISFALDHFEEANKLLEFNSELQKINSELDRFVYSTSHDLRAPLCSILGLVYLIELESQEPQTLGYAGMIRKSIQRLEGFIKSILSYSKNSRLVLETSHIPLQTAIEEIVNSLRTMTDAEGIHFEVKMNEVCPFYSDMHRFNMILENLISNAIKFQDRQQPNRCIRIAGTSNANYLDLQVEDNGIGIAKEHQSRIFDMFFRISGERDGSGIGLYIVREAVAKLQGSIEVASHEHEGTTFTVRLKNFHKGTDPS